MLIVYANMKKIIVCFFAAFIFICCSTVSVQQYHTVAFYTSKINLDVPVENRIQLASDKVISMLNTMDSTSEYQPYSPTADEITLFSEYLELLPEKYKQIIKEKVVAVFFIENFMGGGMTQWVYDKKETMYMVWFFNPEILHRTMAEWINYRENSYFSSDNSSGIAIAVECSSDYFALLHTLVHETSHVYDYNYHITPFTEPFLQDEHSALKTNFTDKIWNDYDRPAEEYDFLYRDSLSAYGLGPAQKKSLSIDIYRSLSKTPFASLYGSQNWAEDFAESFTWFYLEKYLHCTYRIRISKNNEDVFIYEPLLNPLFTSRFDNFKAIMEPDSGQ